MIASADSPSPFHSASKTFLAMALEMVLSAMRATSPASCTALTGEAVMSSSALLRRPARSPMTQLAHVLALAVPVAATVSR